ncbi:superoxide dismutase [Candidatus Soleaferrea massiliensis]|uniref:superoxide dismutase n=1 Tax=Candidatus Soleaferrea massiliensis TaxID=1470354 RepID=UPI0005916DAD|nr:superoxide dismutase [Candidatus Soleaferrea massiliensis]
MFNDRYPFKLPPLPYSYDALEPYIDEKTVMIHHDKHFQTYVDNLNKALKDYPRYHSWTLEELIEHGCKLPENIRTAVHNNAGGVYNHYLYFETLSPNKDQKPTGRLAEAIDRDFGSYDAMKTQLKDAALGRFGSGWAWLVSDENGKLRIISTANQDTPLEQGLCPIIPMDVWEHAYYLLYQNRRADYAENWFRVANWAQADQYYSRCHS